MYSSIFDNNNDIHLEIVRDVAYGQEPWKSLKILRLPFFKFLSVFMCSFRSFFSLLIFSSAIFCIFPFLFFPFCSFFASCFSFLFFAFVFVLPSPFSLFFQLSLVKI